MIGDRKKETLAGRGEKKEYFGFIHVDGEGRKKKIAISVCMMITSAKTSQIYAQFFLLHTLVFLLPCEHFKMTTVARVQE